MKLNFFNKISVLLIVVFASCYPTPKVSGQFTEIEFDQMANKMAKGAAEDISVDELIRIKDSVTLLDSREKKEYDISHISNAKWVGYDDFDLKRVKDLNKNEKIVVYCSIGYRSEKISEKLMKAGFTNVYNLNGSIFKWFNQGYKIVDGSGEKTNKIHGYNKKWSQWIKQGDIIY